MIRSTGVATALIVVVATIVSVWSAQAAALPADLDVEDVECVGGEAASLLLNVQLHADDPMEVTVHTWSERNHVQIAWEPVRVELTPGPNWFWVRAPRERAYLDGSHAQVWVAADQQRAVENWRIEGCP